mmetsp:Transcript_39610/g.89847  ORF Transcript_39610/g.89847 Transcript_39610/m.89847 type:complete len:218 (-) Transcript_39610:197-850(-)
MRLLRTGTAASMKPHAVAVRASLGAETCILHAISTSYHCHIALVITVCQRAKQRGKRRFVVGHICTPPLSGTSQHPLKRQPFTEVVASHSTALKCTDGDTALIPGLPVPSFVIQIQERLRLSATRPGGCDAAIRVITALGRHRRRHRTASDESAALAMKGRSGGETAPVAAVCLSRAPLTFPLRQAPLPTIHLHAQLVCSPQHAHRRWIIQRHIAAE